jgi:hypothetical protein
LFLAKICFEKILPLFSYIFHPIFIPAVCFTLFFTDSEFTSQENYLCFSSCGGNGAIAFVGFFITENSW